ncbi:MAG: hypothetical protein AAF390_13135 [Pseudomonadota bacterium]
MSVEGTGGSRFLYAPFQDTEAAFRRTEDRLAALEAIAKRIETDQAVNEEKQKRLEARFNQIDKRLDRIDALIARLAWLIVAAILGAFMSFLMKGGLPGA